MTSGTAVPLVTVAVILPLPSASLLLPNPLTTRITPPSAIDRSGGEQERVPVAVEGDAFAGNLETIVDGFGNSQYFEIARR
jgi:hypothetical protein